MEPATASLWHRALHDPQLQDLPFKIETNAHGHLVLSPHKPQHSFLQSRILTQLVQHIQTPGEPAVEFALDTPKGIRVPDVVWMSEERIQQIPGNAEASPVMPELCVEVRSESNTDTEMAAKRQLYFEEGATEVWICDPEGRLRFYTADGEQSSSALAPSFPATIE
ncbi:Uma2 family endonuclease [Salisaeta longa]|uniref:Uma2 family endonuclease n=1 Tax=Salisaeta longa TaxID=503170 RepID=UPI0003B3B289|nr:Uma2 family endonuclease [Salisaeta longa]